MQKIQAETMELVLPPEPKIGPGMILERGRERVIVYEAEGDDFRYGVCRRSFGKWSLNPCEDESACGVWFRYLLASGFRVIRKADEEKPNA